MKPTTLGDGRETTDLVPCPRCGACTGERCHNGRGRTYPFGVHNARAAALERPRDRGEEG